MIKIRWEESSQCQESSQKITSVPVSQAGTQEGEEFRGCQSQELLHKAGEGNGAEVPLPKLLGTAGEGSKNVQASPFSLG